MGRPVRPSVTGEQCAPLPVASQTIAAPNRAVQAPKTRVKRGRECFALTKTLPSSTSWGAYVLSPKHVAFVKATQEARGSSLPRPFSLFNQAKNNVLRVLRGCPSRLLRGQHCLGIGFCQIVLGVCLIPARLLGVSGKGVAFLQRHFVVSIGLRHGDIVCAFGRYVVKIIGLVIDLGFRIVCIFGGVLLGIGYF